MNKKQKSRKIEELAQVIANNHFYVTDTQGLTVKQTEKIRALCEEKKVRFKVVKNTLFSKALLQALGENSTKFRKEVLKGVSAVFFTEKKANEPAKIIKTFYKETGLKKPLLKGAVAYDDFFLGDQLQVLSNLKSKEERIGEVLGALQSPLKNILSALNTTPQTLTGLLDTLKISKS